MENTLFVGWDDGRLRFKCSDVLEAHARVRDATANSIHGEHVVQRDIWPFIAVATFTYAFNVYKAIGMVLPQRYHEAGFVMLRQLWEVSLNLHWIERDPESRSDDYCNYTIMEARRLIQMQKDKELLNDFDTATNSFQARFRYLDKRGRARKHSSFAATSIESRAQELGDPWKSDYLSVYGLASMHAHGSPGAVLHQYFVQHAKSPENKEKECTSIVALMSMKILVDDVHLLVRHGIIPNSEKVDAVYRELDAINDQSGDS